MTATCVPVTSSRRRNTRRSSSARPASRCTRGDKFTLNGELTIKGVTRPVELDVEFEGVAQSPYGQEVLGFSANTEIDREDFGITWNQALETGGVMVGKKIKIEIEGEAVRQA